ncbi:hypothetical protein F4777DRAFT_354366 [Nemania sp. FL0916]|nr:hypothetical protein F4777DRAFT_354366 [Nemania sp. FL0916]
MPNMARPKMPPTPASSTEIKGQDHSNKLSSLQLTFELPPSAINQSEASKASTSATKMSPVSPTSTLPYLQPSETVKARRRSSAAQQKETFALPPPPTRSRKIIQMKPCPQEESASAPTPSKSGSGANSQARHAAGSGVAAASSSSSKTGGSNKKQPSATSAAGRKIARKTAHSLIERRRRSKMNEEFAVLKGLIPACTGEMHKLAILQASIEYVRYLEDCIGKLKAQHGQGSSNNNTSTSTSDFRLKPRDGLDDEDMEVEDGAPEAEAEVRSEWTSRPSLDETADADEAQEDVEMTDSSTPSPAGTAPRSAHSSISPALTAQSGAYTHAHAHGSSMSLSPDTYRTQQQQCSTYPALTSPALRPQLEIDHEVSAALLMLGSGRASVSGPSSATSAGSGRGMSVRDLLSS